MSGVLPKIERWLLFALIALWSFVWDYNHLGDFPRDGKLKLMLAAAVVLASFRIARAWHWSVAIAYVYLAGSWLHFCFNQWILPMSGKPFVFDVRGHEEMASVTALLFLCPILAARVSRRAFENLIIGTAAVQAGVGVLNLCGIYPFLPVTQRIETNLPIGFLSQQTIFGPFVAYGACLALLRAISALYNPDAIIQSKWLYGALAAFMATIAILTRSSMTYGSLAAGLIVIALFYGGRRAGVLLALGVAAALATAHHFDHHTFHLSSRAEPWGDALSLWRLRPWTGFGIGSWEPISYMIKEVRHYTFPWSYLHSDPLQILFELGKIGVASVSLVALVLLARIGRVYRARDGAALTWVCALAVFGTDSCANFVLHLVPHGPIFALAIYQILRLGRTAE